VEKTLLQQPDADVASRVDTLSQALRYDPDNASTWHERGLAEISEAGGKSMRQAQPFLKTAAADLEMSLQLNPFNGYPALALADVYDVEGRHDDAEKMIHQALRTMPWHVTPRLALARHFHRMRRWMEAEEAYLWASEGRAYTPENWYTEYMGMLKDAEK
jgi:tetratricopeptide (TPR) repeat protein